MKILKYIGIGLLAIVALILIVGLFAPKQTKVSRSITIDASKDMVMQHISNLKSMHEWSPWAELDPNQKLTFEGNDGEVGSKQTWEGNEKVGKGSQTIIAVNPDGVVTELNFIEPFESKAKATIQAADNNGKTDVTWTFESETPYPMNTMMLFMDMDAMLGKDFEKGLSKLKEVCAAAGNQESASSYEIKEIEMPQRFYIGKREVVSFDKMAAFYGNNFSGIFAAMGKMSIKAAGAPSGIFYKYDEKEMKADMAAAIPVADAKANVKGYQLIEIPAGKALQIAYYGAYEKSGDAHMAIDKYMKEKNLTMNTHVIEEYVTDPMHEPDTSKWLTNIYYMVK